MEKIFLDRNVLSPHYVPEELPFRTVEMDAVARNIAPALIGQKPKNLFIYGKPGTGKTCTVKKAVEKSSAEPGTASFVYINCRIYNSRYRILQRIVREFAPEVEKSGFGLPFLYEKLVEAMGKGTQYVVVLDEIDMVKDLDDMVYTITRSNDETKKGGITIIGISNKLSFKTGLDARSRSSLYENEMAFSTYSAPQLQQILKQRAEQGIAPGRADESAINLTAAIAAQETGDARYALKLFEKAADIAEQQGRDRMTDADVEAARKNVDIDIAAQTIATLPENTQIVLYSIAKITLNGSKYSKLDYAPGEAGTLMSGEVYEEYSSISRTLGKEPRSSRWFKEYLSDLDVLGLVTVSLSGKGVRGHTTLIKLGYDAKGMMGILGTKLGMGE
jgi:archaeal cell division control protein 6